MHIINAFLRLTQLSIRRTRSCCGVDEEDEREGSGEEADMLLPSSHSDHSTDSRTRSLTGPYQDFSRSWSAVQLFVFHATLYYVFAVLGFCFVVEDLPVIDAVYVATVIFTTVGYGDIHPSTDVGRIFTMMLATYGIIILGIFIGVAGEAIVDSHYERARIKAKRVNANVFQRLGTQTSEETSMPVEEEFLLNVSPHQPLWRRIMSIVVLELPVVSIVAVAAIAIGHVEGWSVLER